MNIEQFNYILPEELIADKPKEKRDNSRLLVANRSDKNVEDKKFFEILSYLNKGDVLVVNNSKVIPGRLLGQKKSGGKVEILLNSQILEDVWEVIGKNLKIGDKISFTGSKLKAEVISKENYIYKVHFSKVNEDFWGELYRIGKTPLPPYIGKRLDKIDESFHRERYQTSYAKHEGSVAAPTAGLHFTKELLKKIEQKGIKIIPITLHVGLGTFLPVETPVIEEHKIHKEYFSVSKGNYQKIKRAKMKGEKIFACGTTTVRVLEHLASKESVSKEFRDNNYSGWTDIFIYPGYKFQIIDSIITNFHLPKSTLIMLVAAFAGVEFTKKIYNHAIENKYRFYSYGDAMLIT